MLVGRRPIYWLSAMLTEVKQPGKLLADAANQSVTTKLLQETGQYLPAHYQTQS